MGVTKLNFPILTFSMITSSNGNIFCITGPLCGGIHLSPVNSPHKGQWRMYDNRDDINIYIQYTCTESHHYVEQIGKIQNSDVYEKMKCLNGCDKVCIQNKSMALCKTVVTPLITHWSYCSIALSYQNILCLPELDFLLFWCKHQLLCKTTYDNIFLCTLKSHNSQWYAKCYLLYDIYTFWTITYRMIWAVMMLTIL